MVDILRRISHIPCLRDDVIKWKHFPRYWPFVRGVDRSSVNSSHKGQWCGALMFSVICAWINGWVTNREADELGRHCDHYDITVMGYLYFVFSIAFYLSDFIEWNSTSLTVTTQQWAGDKSAEFILYIVTYMDMPHPPGHNSLICINCNLSMDESSHAL